ncbi:MAG: formate/nitrite transporter family protein [Mycoplasma sp.]
MNNSQQKAADWLHKYFKLDKEYFSEHNKAALYKLNYNWVKKILFATLGGIFIGIGYTGTLLVMGYSKQAGLPDGIAKILGSLLFPVGLLLCIHLGGTLYTSNCMGFVSVLYKEHKTRWYISDLALTLFGNGLGCFLVALIVWSSGTLGYGPGHEMNVVGENIIEIAKHKFAVDHGADWWNNLLSGILCNVIVVGTTLLTISCKNKGVATFIIYLMLVVFVISGYQHVVANFYVFSLGGLASVGTPLAFTATEAGQIFYINLIPAMVGNLIGGIAITGAYLVAQSYIRGRKVNCCAKTETKIEVDTNCAECE